MAHANARMDDAKVADGPGIQEEPHPRRSFWTDDVALPPRTYMPILLTLSFSAACKSYGLHLVGTPHAPKELIDTRPILQASMSSPYPPSASSWPTMYAVEYRIT